jgi:predicted TPR repeat methyltransferase
MSSEHSDGLEKVYAASSGEELAAAYAVWSDAYDRETLSLGYCLPFVITSWIARYVKPGDGPLLDAGCGTGLTGPYLKALGYPEIHGLDFSQKMIDIARTRQCYHILKPARLGGALPWEDQTFAAVYSTGVFTEGHAPASSFDDMVRITKKGGFIIVTVRDTVFERDGFAQKFTDIEAAGLWRTIEISPPFRAFAIAEPEVLVQAFVFQVQ